MDGVPKFQNQVVAGVPIFEILDPDMPILYTTFIGLR